MDRQAVQRYLTDRLGPTTVTRAHQTFPGQSRETWIIETADGDGFVIRVDPPGGPMVPVPMRREYDIYCCLWQSTVPVAEPLWYAADTEFAEGRPHMVRRMVKGTTKVAGLTQHGKEGAGIRRAVAYEVAEKLALVHTLDWKAQGLGDVLPVPASPDAALRDELHYWRDAWTDIRTDPYPLLTEAMYWLEEELPPGGDRLSLVKGNNGVGEEIWDDGRIVAMSDWELASIGEPALDWAFSQGLLSIHDLDDTLAHYGEAAGFEIDPKRLAWAAAWISIKVTIMLNSAMAPYLDGRDLRPALPGLGLSVKPRDSALAHALGRDVETVGRRILAARSSLYID